MAQTLTTSRDIPLFVISTASSSERRITPSWTIAHLKTKLEPITGIPPSSQKLTLRLPEQHQEIAIDAQDEETAQIGGWPLVAHAEIHVTSTNPHPPALPPLSSVPKYEMPTSTYETLPSSVLAFKKSHKLGRFDPSAPEIQAQKIKDAWREVEERTITPGSRCRLGGASSPRHGTIRYVGPIPELPGLPELPWIGVELDEPMGKNDGRVGGDGDGKRFFECGRNRGVFVRPDKVEVGEFGVLDVDVDDEDMEEI